MKRILLIPILIFGAFLVCLYLVAPNFQKFFTFRKEIQEKERILSGKKAYFEQLKKDDVKLADFQNELNKINSAVPQEPFLSSLLYFLQKKSSETGVVLASVGVPSIQAAAQGKQVEVKNYSLNLTLSGSLASFENFLKILEKSSRIIDVESFSFSIAKIGNIHNFTISIKVYSY